MVLLAFLHSQQSLWPELTVYLRGLDPDTLCRIQTIDQRLVEKQEVVSGSFLMNHGINLRLRSDDESTSVTFSKVSD